MTKNDAGPNVFTATEEGLDDSMKSYAAALEKGYSQEDLEEDIASAVHFSLLIGDLPRDLVAGVLERWKLKVLQGETADSWPPEPEKDAL